MSPPPPPATRSTWRFRRGSRSATAKSAHELVTDRDIDPDLLLAGLDRHGRRRGAGQIIPRSGPRDVAFRNRQRASECHARRFRIDLRLTPGIGKRLDARLV